ncbi:MAG: hypothetical protein JSW03_10175 [Candidatus Eiseniibacteriota bacterium]|nr:MAG: hypothetical protein JSW03_10175 [Candidatus Eisenbacteria bacterium]
MKAKVFLLVSVALLLSASAAYAVIGWSGNVWPCNNATYAEDQNIDVYIEVWKEGVTDGEGQGAGITVRLFYKQAGAADYDSVDMTYNVDKGNNDEYKGTIPSAALEGGVQEVFECVVIDDTDGTRCPPTSLYGCGGDQCTNSPPFYLNITPATKIEVLVKFRLCLSDTFETVGDVCVTGGPPELTGWGSGVVMVRPCPTVSPKYYEMDVLFPAGSNPSVQYKYRKNGCDEWEDGANHSCTIDDSGPFQVLPVDGWEYIMPDCPTCATDVEDSTWGRIKVLYR